MFAILCPVPTQISLSPSTNNHNDSLLDSGAVGATPRLLGLHPAQSQHPAFGMFLCFLSPRYVSHTHQFVKLKSKSKSPCPNKSSKGYQKMDLNWGENYNHMMVIITKLRKTQSYQPEIIFELRVQILCQGLTLSTERLV